MKISKLIIPNYQQFRNFQLDLTYPEIKNFNFKRYLKEEKNFNL